MIDPKFKIGDRVYCIDLKGDVFVDAYLVTADTISYQICYWHNGDRKTVWVREFEIELTKKP